jgi:hypothetical protein
MAASEHRVTLLQPVGSVPMGVYRAASESAAIVAAAKACNGSLRKLALQGYKLQCGATTCTLADLHKIIG